MKRIHEVKESEIAFSFYISFYYEVRSDFLYNKTSRFSVLAPKYNKKNPIVFPRYPGSDKKSMIFKFLHFKRPRKFTKDNFASFTMALDFQQNDILYKAFHTEIVKLIETGILNTFEDRTVSEDIDFKSLFKVLSDKKDFVPLSMEMLEAGFKIWLVTFLSSFLVFLMELIFFNAQKAFASRKKRRELLKRDKPLNDVVVVDL